MTLRDIIRLITPPLFIRLAQRLRGNRHVLSGDYQSWDEAMAASTGYDSEIILKKTATALLKVKNGEAAYERDSVLFDEIQYSYPLLAGLMYVAANSGGRLNVLDFGGSLGSTYFQNRRFMSSLPTKVRWNIVEQPSHVRVGKAYFEDDYLRFYTSFSDCLADTKPNVVLLSGVLQYLEYPYTVFDHINGSPCNYVIIDRTPFWTGPADRLCVQTVPPSIYPASYPIWIFSKQRFHDYLSESFSIVTEYESLDNLNAPVKALWQGLILERGEPVIMET